MGIAKHRFNKCPNAPEYLNKHALRIWKENYGVCPKVALEAWKRVSKKASKTEHAGIPQYFWALKVLKSGSFQNTLAASLGTSAKTLRKWFWFFLKLLSNRVTDVVSTLIKYYYNDLIASLILYCPGTVEEPS